MHRTVMIVAALLVAGLIQAAAAAGGNPTTEESRGLTVDDLGRGLKSAARNVEKEIPKMGAAIGSAFKKITEKGLDKPSSKKPEKQNK